MTDSRMRIAQRSRTASAVRLPLRFVKLNTGLVWYLTTRRSATFAFGGEQYRYFFHTYNRTFWNERCVEVPIVRRALERHGGGSVLEVGNVLSHYQAVRHSVLDKYERARGVLNEDVLDHAPPAPYGLILSISTLEHVGWDEHPRDPDKARRAIEHLCALLDTGGRLIATVPLGYNPHLDRMLRAGEIPLDSIRYLSRLSARNDWVEVGAGAIADARYDEPWLGASAIAILEHSAR